MAEVVSRITNHRGIFAPIVVECGKQRCFAGVCGGPRNTVKAFGVRDSNRDRTTMAGPFQRRSAFHLGLAVGVRMPRPVAKRAEPDPNNYSPLEYMDIDTGKYKVIVDKDPDEGSANGESADEESEDELLKRFAAAIGLNDEDLVETIFDKMRNPSTQKIVQQLEEGIGDVEDLFKAVYGDDPEFRELYATVDSLIRKEDDSSARDIVQGNYEALLDQLNNGIVGSEQIALLDVLAHLYLLLEDRGAAEHLLGQAVELLDHMPDTEIMVANTLEHIATLYLKLRLPIKALPLFKRSVAAKKAAGADISLIVRSMVGLANAHSELRQGKECVEIYKQILAYAEEALGTEDEDLAAPLMHLGTSLLDTNKFSEAELVIERAMNLTKKTSSVDNGRYGVAACILGQIKAAKGDFEEALELLQSGLKVMEVCKDFTKDPHLDNVRVDLAALLGVLEREEEARKVLKTVNIHDKDLFEYYSSQKVSYLEAQAKRYAEEGELEKSERALRRSLQLLLANVGPDSIPVSVVLQLLATLLHAQPHRKKEAEPLVRESLQIREKKWGRYHIAVGESCSYLASILHEQEQDEEALHLMYRVLDIQEREWGVDSPQLVETLDVLNLLLTNLDRHQEIIAIDQRLEQIRPQPSSSFSV